MDKVNTKTFYNISKLYRKNDENTEGSQFFIKTRTNHLETYK